MGVSPQRKNGMPKADSGHGMLSMDKLLAAGHPLDESAPGEAEHLTFGRDTLISTRERAEVVAAFDSPLAERQPHHLARIYDVLVRTKLGDGAKTEVVQALARTVQLVCCAKGRPIVEENEGGEYMYILLSGQCIVEKADRARPRPCWPAHRACAHLSRMPCTLIMPLQVRFNGGEGTQACVWSGAGSRDAFTGNITVSRSILMPVPGLQNNPLMGHAGRGHLRTVRTLTVGDSFGDLALQEAGGSRAATVRTAAWCELLTINGFAYRKILAKVHRQDMNARVRLRHCRSHSHPVNTTCISAILHPGGGYVLLDDNTLVLAVQRRESTDTSQSAVTSEAMCRSSCCSDCQSSRASQCLCCGRSRPSWSAARTAWDHSSSSKVITRPPCLYSRQALCASSGRCQCPKRLRECNKWCAAHSSSHPAGQSNAPCGYGTDAALWRSRFARVLHAAFVPFRQCQTM